MQPAAQVPTEIARAERPDDGEPTVAPRPGVMPQVAHYLGLVRGIESELRDACLLVAERHERNPEVAHGATTLALWSADHLAWLEPHITRWGATASPAPAQLRAALFGGSRAGAMGELADIADLAVLVEQASMTWTILAQGAKELHDQALVAVATSAREHNRRQLAWLRTQIEHEAPDAIAVVPSPGRKIETALPARPGDVAAIPDALWVPLAAGGLLLAVGALGLLARQPWLLPSLGPTAVLLALMPAHPTARPWNIFAGHLGGLLAGFAAVAVLGAASAPTVLGDGQLTPIRVLVAGIAVALTIVIGDLSRATHPPAAATTLLVALGSIATFEQALWVVGGVAAITVLGEVVRRARLERPAPAERRGPPTSILSARLRARP